MQRIWEERRVGGHLDGPIPHTQTYNISPCPQSWHGIGHVGLGDTWVLSWLYSLHCAPTPWPPSAVEQGEEGYPEIHLPLPPTFLPSHWGQSTGCKHHHTSTVSTPRVLCLPAPAMALVASCYPRARVLGGARQIPAKTVPHIQAETALGLL